MLSCPIQCVAVGAAAAGVPAAVAATAAFAAAHTPALAAGRPRGSARALRKNGPTPMRISAMILLLPGLCARFFLPLPCRRPGRPVRRRRAAKGTAAGRRAEPLCEVCAKVVRRADNAQSPAQVQRFALCTKASRPHFVPVSSSQVQDTSSADILTGFQPELQNDVWATLVGAGNLKARFSAGPETEAPRWPSFAHVR